jgi:hypothetical protein
MVEELIMTPIPQNYSKQVGWIFGAYEDAGVTLENGFQKDSIQNAAGARRSNKWKNWTCKIYLETNDKGIFLVVEDSGTEGLSGANLSSAEIQHMIDYDIDITPDMRLARFTSMNNSGGNQTGGGLYGVGKAVYAVASNDYDYYFDSLREDGIYIANRNNKGSVHSKAFENDDAKKYILENTGFTEKLDVGTRIIIVNPKQELIDAIEDGTIVKYIQQTWWLIIGKFDENSFISVNGHKVGLPVHGNTVKSYVLPAEYQYKPGYRIKHFGLYINENAEDGWDNISFYRKGMKIGKIDISEVPEKIRGKYWGYVEVDGLWEEELALIEDKVHYGVSKGKKTKAAYQYLKNYVNDIFRTLLIEWGYIKNKENEDKKLNDELQKIAEDIQELFDNLGFEDLGKGPKKSDFAVRWQNVKYPQSGSEKVTTGEEIEFTIRITSDYLTKKKFEYSLSVLDMSNRQIVSQISNSGISIDAGQIYTEEFKLKINRKTATQYQENRIVLSVKVQGSGKEKVKDLPFFYDIEKPDNSRREVVLTIASCKYPKDGSKRINFNECLRDLVYHIENKRNNELKFRMNISVHNATDPSNPKICDVCSCENKVDPYEDILIDAVPDITFDEETYSKYLNEGQLELRARLIALEDSGEFEKGDRITEYHLKIYLNCDEKNGKVDAFNTKTVDLPDDYRRSWYVAGNDRTIYLNAGHVAYLLVKDNNEIQHEYIKEQMLKQYVLLYLAERKYAMFGSPDDNFESLDQLSAVDRVIGKVEEVYYRSLGA